MKGILGIFILFILFYTLSAEDLEGDNYTILEKIDDIEIREYKKLIYASYTPTSINERNGSFRNIAGYIFGDNEKMQKIDMTSPVIIKLHNNNEMAFIMPEEYSLNNLPKPKNTDIDIYEEPSNIKACLKYSGYSNKRIEKKKIKQLTEQLNKYNIEHKNDFEVLVYNSPYQLLNRKNEIVVSIQYNNKIMEKSKESNLKKIYFGGGCFWCTEAIFENVIGVTNVTSGYCGGKIKNPSYTQVSKGLTKHAEVCEVIYDNEKITLNNLLEIFFFSHDPTTLNKQGNDIGSHYRSIILYASNNEKDIIKNYITTINEDIFDNKIITELKKFEQFYKAEAYHQNYYNNNKNASYCQLIITPKIIKTRKGLNKYYK